MFLVKFVKFYRIWLLQKTAGGSASDFQQHFGYIICCISSKSYQSQLTVGLELSQRVVCKQFTVFVSKIFKKTKVEGHIFCGWGRHNKKGYLAEAITQRCLQEKRFETFGKTHRKHFCRRVSLLLHRCFPVKFIRAAFS